MLAEEKRMQKASKIQKRKEEKRSEKWENADAKQHDAEYKKLTFLMDKAKVRLFLQLLRDSSVLAQLIMISGKLDILEHHAGKHGEERTANAEKGYSRTTTP